MGCGGGVEVRDPSLEPGTSYVGTGPRGWKGGLGRVSLWLGPDGRSGKLDVGGPETSVAWGVWGSGRVTEGRGRNPSWTEIGLDPHNPSDLPAPPPTPRPVDRA